SHTYSSGTFTVTLITEQGTPCADTATQVVVINANGFADFSGTSVCLNETTVFTDLSTATSGSIVAWHWDFGDVTAADTSILQNPSYAYSSSGTYTATLAT